MPQRRWPLGFRSLHGLFACWLCISPLALWAEEPPAAAPDFERAVVPLLVRRCLGCHNESQAAGGLVLTDHAKTMAGGLNGPVIAPGKPDESHLIERVAEGSMPPDETGPPLTPDELTVLRGWIAAGAPWPAERTVSPYEFTTDQRAGLNWWSFKPPVRPEIPATDPAAAPIDALVIAKLTEHGLRMAPEADRSTLIRRATFDLTGLPPTPEEVEGFLADQSADAYAKLIDRLLASPHYGERWAQHWLDVVRFSESKGFERDRLRDNSWRYRDWVIASLNADLPYDQFVLQQLAGDVLNPDDPQAAVPTGFVVTGPNNDVGNGSEVERQRERTDEIDDFVTNTTATFLGLTVGCARCHDHKFDPIPTRDYYRLSAVFAGVQYGDQFLATAAQHQERKAKVAAIDGEIKSVDEQLAKIDEELDRLDDTRPNARRNEIAFAPVVARYVRFEIERTQDGGQPAIDEFEIFAGDVDAGLNLALGAAATASSLLPGYPIHQIAHLNDGHYGNDHSWISNEAGTGWIQLRLPETATVGRVIWGRDREQQFSDRVAAAYVISTSLDGQNWSIVARRPDPQSPKNLEPRVVELRAEREQLTARKAELGKQREAVPGYSTTWAIVGKTPPATHILKRGDVTTPADEVAPGALSAVASLTSALSVDPAAGDGARRLALAQWIVAPANPLTARVMVNRIWQHHFGAGLIENSSDFGWGSGLPSHPELLDWLAVEFVAHGWSIKQMHRQIMLSATYRQSTAGEEKAAMVDANNRWLWRASRRRLTAEEIRDAILASAGTLDNTLGGPSFRPFKYTDGNIPVYESLLAREQADPANGNLRRAIYRHIVRSQSVPFLDAFDCPDSSVMAPKRSQTTTPLQALSLLNNEFVSLESARLAERLRREAGRDAAAQARRAVWLVFGCAATEAEVERLAGFVRRQGLERLGRALWNANEFLYVN